MTGYLKYITIILFLFININLFPQKSLTLKDVLSMTVNNSYLIKQKEYELNAAKFRVEQQKSTELPTAVANASYTRVNPISKMAFAGHEYELNPADNINAGITVHQIIYDFGKRESQVNYASSLLNSISDNEEAIKNDLSNQAINIFYGILYLQQSSAVKDTEYAALTEHLKTSELKVKDGSATDYDALSTKAKIAQTKNEQIEIKNEIEKQFIVLEQLTGIDRKSKIDINGELELPASSFNVDSVINSAFYQRPELKLLADEKNSAMLMKDAAALLDQPVLSADVGYGFKNGYEPNLDAIRGNWAANVTVSVPVFNGYVTKNKIGEADASIEADNQKILHARDLITTDVYNSLNDFRSAVEKINNTSIQIEYAEKSLERVKLRYNSGSATNLEVLDAETMLTQARLQYIQAKYKSVINYYMVRKAAGDKIYNM
jgi:outer membrane protein TolC